MPRTAYENFPLPLALLSVLISASVYALGAYVLSGTTSLTASLYIACCALLELWVLKESCVHCYYYGRVCGLGRGKVCSLLFRRGDPRSFVQRQICWKDRAPEFFVVFMPLLGGAYLLAVGFSWSTLGAMTALLLLSRVGKAVVRWAYSCKFCKQKELGCPALAIFPSVSAS
jgi:hypothetical protein